MVAEDEEIAIKNDEYLVQFVHRGKILFLKEKNSDTVVNLSQNHLIFKLKN